MSSSLTWNAQKKKATTTADAVGEVGSDTPAGGGIIAAFDEEIARLRTGLRTWPPAADELERGERLVLLMRMRVQLLQSNSRQNAVVKDVTMSPASASLSQMRLSAVTGLDKSRAGEFIDNASELKGLEAQRMAGEGGEETEQHIQELKTKQREILSGIVPAVAWAKRWNMARRSKL